MSDGDEKQLFQNCKFLEEQLSHLKELKLSSAVQIYRYECEKQADQQISTSIAQIEAAYAKKMNQVENLYENNSLKSKKNHEQIAKQKMAFLQIMDHLEERKSTIEEEYGENLRKLIQIKDQNVSEWKRQSNQQIKRVTLNSCMGQQSNRRVSKKMQIPQIMYNQMRQETQECNYQPYDEELGEKQVKNRLLSF